MNFGAEFGLALGFFSISQTALIYWCKGLFVWHWYKSTRDNQLVAADLLINAQLKRMRLASVFSGFFVGLSVFFIITGESAYKPSVHDISLPFFFSSSNKNDAIYFRAHGDCFWIDLLCRCSFSVFKGQKAIGINGKRDPAKDSSTVSAKDHPKGFWDGSRFNCCGSARCVVVDSIVNSALMLFKHTLAFPMGRAARLCPEPSLRSFACLSPTGLHP